MTTGPEHFRQGLRLLAEAKDTPRNYTATTTALATLATAEFAAATAMAAAEAVFDAMHYHGVILVGETEADAIARRDAWAQVIRP